MRMPIRVIGFCAVLATASGGVICAQTNVTTAGGTINQVPKMSGDFTIIDSAITESDGSVGIGTTSPQDTLHVVNSAGGILVSNGIASDYSTIETRGDSIILSQNIGVAAQRSVQLKSVSDYGYIGLAINALDLSSGYGGPAGSPALNYNLAYFNAQTGNVGIGTTSPGSKFTVQSNATQGGGPQILIQGATNTGQQLYLGYDTSADAGFIQAFDQGIAYNPLILNGGGGNVGIGTTSPSVKLDVAGSEQVSGTLALPALGSQG